MSSILKSALLMIVLPVLKMVFPNVQKEVWDWVAEVLRTAPFEKDLQVHVIEKARALEGVVGRASDLKK